MKLLRLFYSSYRPLVASFALAFAVCCNGACWAQDGAEQPISIAVLPFETQGDAEVQTLISQLLTAELSVHDDWLLVEREQLDRLLDEAELNLSGLVRQNEAIRIGQLTGAKILVTGSLLTAGENRYLIAKLIGTETSRVVGVSVKRKGDVAADKLIQELADKTIATLQEKADSLVAEPVSKKSRIAKLKKRVRKHLKSGGQLPSISIALSEQHVGRRIDDPAAQTEIEGVLAELGFKLVEAKKKSQADIQLLGEGISEFATRNGDLISVRGRVELKATRRGVLLFSDRQSTIAVGLSEAVTSKDALQAAAASLLDRIVPQLLKGKK